MGLLIIDHSGMDKKPGTKWGLHELRTTQCVHCQGTIAHFTRGCTEYAISGVDLFQAILHASDLPSHAVEACGCSKCGALICQDCARMMEKFCCPGPYKAQLEKAMEQQQ